MADHDKAVKDGHKPTPATGSFLASRLAMFAPPGLSPDGMRLAASSTGIARALLSSSDSTSGFGFIDQNRRPVTCVYGSKPEPLLAAMA